MGLDKVLSSIAEKGHAVSEIGHFLHLKHSDQLTACHIHSLILLWDELRRIDARESKSLSSNIQLADLELEVYLFAKTSQFLSHISDMEFE